MGLALVIMQVRRSRLLYASRLARHASPMLRHLIADTSAWRTQLHNDVEWLREKSEKLYHTPPLMVDPVFWHTFWVRHSAEWRTIVKQACGLDTAMVEAQVEQLQEGEPLLE